MVAYVAAGIPFDHNGEWRVLALVRNGEALEATRAPSIVVGKFESVPDVGDKALRIHTPTVDDVGDVSKSISPTPMGSGRSS